ncbi:ABC transporter ATP-binding protein [Brevibacillus fluminis]|uniref:ABC transporter ATP-binding protein n=1 Tax=Brevibacillus fluminis TaxID=511487 RepID=A0A3M8DH44_9BACL|nr:ABC-F family ATP-binding cassette domain-containing protein [Brevibacillus fluminis]RNB87354.1 ABC transporter ATP-binding protein [Brevibacillus fluminis]
MILAATNAMTKSYGAHPVLENITIEIHAGERVGIVGPNGAGKSTLCKILCGQEVADSGEIFKARGSRWSYLPQTPVYPDEWTGRDVIASAFAEVSAISGKMRELEQQMGGAAETHGLLEQLLGKYQQLQEQFEQLDGYRTETVMAQVTTGLGISEPMLDMLFARLSGGEQTKIGLAKLLCEASDVLLLDEPTNHLDVEAMEWLEEFLREYKGTVLAISHDRYFLDRIVTSIIEIDCGEATQYPGNYSAYVTEREERLLRQFAEYEEQQRKIKKMQETIKRLKEWGNRSNPPNEGFHRRAKSMEKALARIERIERPKLEADRMALAFKATDRSGTDVLIAEGVGKTFEGKTLFADAELLLRYGERKALLGPNGCGKSTLMKMLIGDLTPDAGTVRLGASVQVGYLSQKAIEGDPNRRVIDAFREIAKITEPEARHRLAKFLFYGEQVYKRVGQLSGGERMRLRLAQLMHQPINLLLLDEPTNHLDIEARETLEEAIAEFRGSLFIVSHDRYFLQKMVDGVFWIDEKKIVRYEGRYEEAREQRRRQLAAKQAALVTVPSPQKQVQPKPAAQEPASTKQPEKKVNPYQLQKLEEQIAQLEAERLAAQQQLAEESNDYAQLAQWQTQLERVEAALAESYDRWYELQPE